MHEEFYRDGGPEPHVGRRRAILEKYPEIRKLEGYCWKTKYIVAAMIVTQLTAAWWIADKSLARLVLLAFVLGGTINHTCSLAAHELSHNLGFASPFLNRVLAILSDIPKVVPSAITFRRYHLEHHMYQGTDGYDVDIPTDLEHRVIGHNVFTKFIFVVCQSLFYALRPLAIRPKDPGMWEFANYAVIITTDFLVYHFFGGRALAYLGLSSFIGHGLHPCAGHFISEHYVFTKGYETYSYYGPLNWLTFHVGYHNEHHDFAAIPGSRLHKVREIAPEFYNNLPHHNSWIKVLWDFVTDKNIGMNSRVTRPAKEKVRVE